MTNVRVVVFLALLPFCSPFQGAKIASDNAKTQPVIALTRANNGQGVSAAVGQLIQIDLETLQGAGYGLPQVSSPSVIYQNSVLSMPVNPGGPLPVFVFEAVRVGEADISIPRHDAPGFAVTVEVTQSLEKAQPILDQSNTNATGSGWTNLVNHAVQTFTPQLPKLLRVEVELVKANPGPDPDSVTLTVLNSHGDPMVIAEKTLPASDAGWVSFVFTSGGLDVTPGEVYAIEVNGSTRFGWKYVENGYGKGEALFNGKPILKGAHASFLFKTFGAN